MKSERPTHRPYTQTARAEAAEATGRRITDAFLARLMAQWYDEITLDRVAADAGVTVQTVIRRFGGKEGLLAAAVKTFGEQVNARRTAPAGDVGKAVASLMADYEEVGDAVLRLLALEPRHPALQEVLRFGRSEHRRWVGEAFAPAFAGHPPAARERTLDALVVVTDVYTWKLYRRDMGRSVPATAAALRQLVEAVLGRFSPPTGPGGGS